MSAPIPQMLSLPRLPERLECTPGRSARYVVHAFGFGLIGGWGFGGFIGAVTLLAFAGGVVFTEASEWRVFGVTGLLGSLGAGYYGWRLSRLDGHDRDDSVVNTLLFALAGAVVGAAPIFPATLYAGMIGVFVGALPGVALWLVYGLVFVLFARRRYGPAMDIAAFTSDARRLAALTTWLAVGPVCLALYLLIGAPTSTSDALVACALLGGLATLTAPFAWWHSKFLIVWWLEAVAESHPS